MHLISICCLFAASKVQEIVPIFLSDLIKKVGNKKFSKQDILSAELLILTKLKYKLPRNFFLDAMSIFYEKKYGQKKGEEHRAEVIRACSLVYKMLLMDYSFGRNEISMVKKFTAIFNYSLTMVGEVNDEVEASFANLNIDDEVTDLVNYIEEKRDYVESNADVYQYIAREFDTFNDDI